MKNNQQYYSVPNLIERGWTKALIAKFAGAHDCERKNPMFASAGAPMRFWQMEKIERIEATPEFQAAKAKAAGRSAAGKKVAQMKREEILAAIDAMQINVAQMSAEELLHNAINSYNEFGQELALERGIDREAATPDSDPLFLLRIQVNYLRHNETQYDSQLAALYGKIGKKEAIDSIRERIYDAIAEAYPFLREECDRQLARKREENFSVLGPCY